MAHRVIQGNSDSTSGATEQQIKDIKNEIKVEASGYSTHFSEINDGLNEEGRFTIGVNIDFNDATDANTFHTWLKQKFTDNTSLLETARTRIHDCYHAADENQPCMIGDVWNL
jgi:hypothetical protein